MTSFPVDIEPGPQPRVAATVLLLHLAAAALPWATRCEPWIAVPVASMAIVGLLATIARVPGRHCRLLRLAFRGDAWQAGLAGDVQEVAVIGPGTRVYANLVVLDLLTARGRVGWLLPRAALDVDQFRRLKVRLRLAC